MAKITSMSNPITRSTMRIDPPFEYAKKSEYTNFELLFNDYCIRAWDRDYRTDPKTADPADILAGRTHPDLPTALHDALAPLIAEYGQFAVQQAARDYPIGVRRVS